MKATRREVYRLALESRAGTQIARDLGISRQAVSRHLLALVKDGYLRPLGTDSRPRIYRRTTKLSRPCQPPTIGDGPPLSEDTGPVDCSKSPTAPSDVGLGNGTTHGRDLVSVTSS